MAAAMARKGAAAAPAAMAVRAADATIEADDVAKDAAEAAPVMARRPRDTTIDTAHTTMDPAEKTPPAARPKIAAFTRPAAISILPSSPIHSSICSMMGSMAAAVLMKAYSRSRDAP